MLRVTNGIYRIIAVGSCIEAGNPEFGKDLDNVGCGKRWQVLAFSSHVVVLENRSVEVKGFAPV